MHDLIQDELTQDENKLLKALQAFYDAVACCPINKEIMKDPMITPDGYCYERKDLERVLTAHHYTPKGVYIPPDKQSEMIVINYKLQMRIREFEASAQTESSGHLLIAHYFTFFSELSEDKLLNLILLDDPVVATVDQVPAWTSPTGYTTTRLGGNQGAKAWGDFLATNALSQVNPATHGRLDFISARQFASIGYLGLQEAILNFSMAVKQIKLDRIHETYRNKINEMQIINYRPFPFKGEEGPMNPARPIRFHSELTTLRLKWSATAVGFCSISLLLYGLVALLNRTPNPRSAEAVHVFAFAFLSFAILTTMSLLPVTGLLYAYNPRLDTRSCIKFPGFAGMAELFIWIFSWNFLLISFLHPSMNEFTAGLIPPAIYSRGLHFALISLGLAALLVIPVALLSNFFTMLGAVFARQGCLCRPLPSERGITAKPYLLWWPEHGAQSPVPEITQEPDLEAHRIGAPLLSLAAPMN